MENTHEHQMTNGPVRVVGAGMVGAKIVSGIARRLDDPGVCCIVDTDARPLQSDAGIERKLIGCEVTGGCGTGKDRTIGADIVERERSVLEDIVSGSRLLFIAAALGGGTGALVAPALAEAGREAGAVVTVVAIEPFQFEGVRRHDGARQSLERITAAADTTILVSPGRATTPKWGDNSLQSLKQWIIRDVSAACGMLLSGTERPETGGLEFADLLRVLRLAGPAVIGHGTAEGSVRVDDAVANARMASFIDKETLGSASAALLYLAGDESLPLADANLAAQTLEELAPHLDVVTCVDTNGSGSAVVEAAILLTGIGSEDFCLKSTFFADVLGESRNGLIEPNNPFIYDDENLEIPTYIRMRRKGLLNAN